MPYMDLDLSTPRIELSGKYGPQDICWNHTDCHLMNNNGCPDRNDAIIDGLKVLLASKNHEDLSYLIYNK